VFGQGHTGRYIFLPLTCLEANSHKPSHKPHNNQTLEKSLSLLENYVTRLAELDTTSDNGRADDAQAYYMPSDIVSPSEWAEFDNVYQVHCPKIYMDCAVRDVRFRLPDTLISTHYVTILLP
jgi:hypothetical protein